MNFKSIAVNRLSCDRLAEDTILGVSRAVSAGYTGLKTEKFLCIRTIIINDIQVGVTAVYAYYKRPKNNNAS